MKRAVRVTVDGAPRRLAAGLTVRHLLTAEQLELVRAGQLAVTDGRGNEIGLGGAITDGAVVRLVPRRAP